MASTAAVLDILIKAETLKATAEIHKFDRELSKVQKTAKTTDRSVATTGKRMDGLGNSATHANQSLSLIGKSMNLIKWPAMIAGAGAAAEGLAAAAGGATALAGALAPLAGLAAGGTAALETMGQVKLVFTLAEVDKLKTAVGGLNEQLDQSSTEFKQLSPEAQQFAIKLNQVKAPIRDIQAAVSKPLFAGLSSGLDAARGSLPAFQKVLRGTAKALGQVAERMGRFVGSKAFSSDLTKIGRTNNRLLTRMGGVLVNLAKAFTDIQVAARPLVGWLGKLTSSWSKTFASFTDAQRKSGGLTDFFEKTKGVAGDLVAIFKNVGMALFNISKAGAPLGREIIDKLRIGARLLREWTESTSGQNAIAQYFKDIRAPLFEAGKLLVAITKAFFEVGKQSGGMLAPLLKQIRTELLPVLTSVVSSTAQAFGPKLVNLLVQVTKLFGSLAGTSGPLNIWIDTLSKLAEGLNWLIEHVPGMKQVVITLISFKAISSAMNFAGAITGIKGLVTWFTTLGTVAERTRGQILLMKVVNQIQDWYSSAVGAIKRFVVAIRAAVVAEGLMTVATRALVSATVIGALVTAAILIATHWEKVKEVFSNVANYVKDHLAVLLAIPVAGPLLFAASQIIKHWSAIVGFFKGLAGKFGAAASAIAKVIKGPFIAIWHGITAVFRKGADAILGIFTSIIDGIAKVADAGSHLPGPIGDAWDKVQAFAEDTSDSVNKMRESIRGDTDAMGKHAKKMAGAYESAGTSIGNTVASMAAKTGKAGKDMDSSLDKVGQSATQNTNEAGQSFDRLGGKSQTMRDAVRGSVKNAANAVGTGMGNIAANTNQALKAMNVKELKFAIERASFQTGGVIVPGQGSGDKVPAMLEPGEVVLNRKAVAAMGGANKANSINQAVPRFQEGGVVQRFAKGGVIEQALGPYTIPPIQFDPNHAGSNSHVHADFFTTGQALSYGHKMQGMGWSIGEYTPKAGNPYNFGPITTQHQSPGHYDGTAFDANTAADETRAQVAAVAKLFSGGSVGGTAAAVVQKIKEQILKGPDGPLKDIGQAALDKVHGAANAYLQKVAPKGQTTSADGGGGAIPAKLPAALQKYNHRYPGAIYPSAAWSNLYQMPFNAVAALAEWAGKGRVPGVTMAQVSQGEGVLRPGSRSSDGGWGLWAITSPFNDAAVAPYGGYPGMLNPISNALVMAQIFDPATAFGPIWHGISHVTDRNAHYSGPLLKQAGGIVQGLAKGGKVAPFDPSTWDNAPMGHGPGLSPLALLPMNAGSHTLELMDHLRGMTREERRAYAAAHLKHKSGVDDDRAALGFAKANRKRDFFRRGGVAKLAEGGQVGKMMAEMGRMNALHSTYVYGGGHVNPAPATPPWDCSSAVSRILQVGGFDWPTSDSSGLMNFGSSGSGKLTVFANPEHTFMSLAGRYWGTSRTNRNGGPGWISESANDISAFTRRTADVSGGGGSGGGSQSTDSGGGGSSGPSPAEEADTKAAEAVPTDIPHTINGCNNAIDKATQGKKHAKGPKEKQAWADRLKALRAQKVKLIAAKHNKKFAKHIAKFALMGKWPERLTKLSGAVDMANEDVSALQTMGDHVKDPEKAMGAALGKTLGAQMAYRWGLINASVIESRRANDLQAQLDVEMAKKPKNRNKSAVTALQTGIDSLIEFRDSVIGTGVSDMQGMVRDITPYQPPYATEKGKDFVFNPPYGTLRGEILNTQTSMRDLFTSEEASAVDDLRDERIAGLEKMLREANLRTAVSQRQYGVLGAMASGGKIAQSGFYMVGERGPEIVGLQQGGQVYSNTDSQQMLSPTVVINGDIINTPAGKQPVEVLDPNGKAFATAVKKVRPRGGNRNLPGSRQMI